MFNVKLASLLLSSKSSSAVSVTQFYMVYLCTLWWSVSDFLHLMRYLELKIPTIDILIYIGSSGAKFRNNSYVRYTFSSQNIKKTFLFSEPLINKYFFFFFTATKSRLVFFSLLNFVKVSRIV